MRWTKPGFFLFSSSDGATVSKYKVLCRMSGVPRFVSHVFVIDNHTDSNQIRYCNSRDRKCLSFHSCKVIFNWCSLFINCMCCGFGSEKDCWISMLDHRMILLLLFNIKTFYRMRTNEIILFYVPLKWIYNTCIQFW